MKPGAFLLLTLAILFGCPPSPDTVPSDHKPPPVSQSQVSTATPVTLPWDHRAHPEEQLEWWYLTANLTDSQGRPYPVQFTLFRFRDNSLNDSHWSDNQLWMAHFSLNSASQHWFEQRMARGGTGYGGLSLDPFSLTLDNWQWQSESADTPFPARLSVALEDNLNIQLDIDAQGSYVVHGLDGYSQKSADGQLNSHYYSQPFLQVSGEFNINGQNTKVSGPGWYDHEWTSSLMGERAAGWDWFSLHLKSGAKLMAFRMRQTEGVDYVTGTLIKPDGQHRTLSAQELILEPLGYEQVQGRRLPTKWRLSIPAQQQVLTIERMKPDQWNPGLYPYYEGGVAVSGTETGVGFMELTGY